MARPTDPSGNGTLQPELRQLRRALKAAGNPERAVQEKRYLKSPFRFFGVSLPKTDAIARAFRNNHRDAERAYILTLVEALWHSDYHDEKRLGLRILTLYPNLLDIDTMPMLETMLAEWTGWDLVDDISIHLVGSVLQENRKANRYLRKWSRSDSYWLRRAALISQILLFRKGTGDKKLFFHFAERMIGDKEFFIRKAIGWGLRELSKTDPDAVFSFLLRVKDRASGLTLREGSKRLPEKQRSRFLKTRSRG